MPNGFCTAMPWMWLSSDTRLANPSYARTAEPRGGCLDIYRSTTMSAVLKEPDSCDDDERNDAMRLVELCRQDDYWRLGFRREFYCRPDFDYEDYAPAYCVGYAGQAQYGGSFEDAERSLCANWERIKGDSRLTLADAMPAMRAAWERMDRAARPALTLRGVGTFRRRMKVSSFKPAVAVAR
jgi:hypothetical protein